MIEGPLKLNGRILSFFHAIGSAWKTQEHRLDQSPSSLPGGTERNSVLLNLEELVKPAVLIVDDDQRGLFAMAEVLRDATHHVVVAHSGDEALKHLLHEEFAVILLDVRMPGLSGYETATLIRSRESTRNIPIIFMSAFDKDDVHVFEGYSAGAVDYLLKPIKPEILKAKVSVFCELYRSKAIAERNAQAARQLYDALRRREEEQSLIIQLLPIALYKVPYHEGFGAPRFVRGNVEQLTGFDPERFLNDGKLWAERIHPADRDRTLREFARIAKTGLITAEYRWERADGTYRHLLDQAVFIRQGEEHGEVFGVWLDISHRKQLEQRLQHTHGLEQLGLLAGGIAHDFGNLLTAIMGSFERIAGLAGSNEPMSAALAAGQRAASRGESLVELLSTFSRQRTFRPETVDLADHLPGTVNLLRAALPVNIAVELDVSPGLWSIHADPSELELALLNLSTNARDAMPNGGVLRISAKNTVRDDDEEDGLSGEFVALSITDTGGGIAPEILERVFEPFFTTKPTGKGSGLGLSQIYGFAKQSGGTVEIESTISQGTRVTMYLPRPLSV